MTQPPLIALDWARSTAQAVIAARFGEVANLTLLNPDATDQRNHVFRADLAQAGHVIVKIGDPDRIALAAARLAEVYPNMREGRFRVPQVLLHDAGKGALVMEDARGQSAERLFLSGPAGLGRTLASAGAWIARFHKPNAHMRAFNPDPHLNWLQKQRAAHLDGTRLIPDFAAFDRTLADLTKSAEATRGQPVLRTVTHRDFHLRNLLIRNLGRVYGIDFENAKRDEALRDLLFFLADAAKISATMPTADHLRAWATALRASYNRPLGAGSSQRIFQTAFALSGWASLGGGHAAPGPNRARALAVMQLIAATDDLFADP